MAFAASSNALSGVSCISASNISFGTSIESKPIAKGLYQRTIWNTFRKDKPCSRFVRGNTRDTSKAAALLQISLQFLFSTDLKTSLFCFTLPFLCDDCDGRGNSDVWRYCRNFLTDNLQNSGSVLKYFGASCLLIHNIPSMDFKWPNMWISALALSPQPVLKSMIPKTPSFSTPIKPVYKFFCTS